MDKEEWIARYVARMGTKNVPVGYAAECAENGDYNYEEENPEDAADEEMSYMSDDEG